jgi:hypothetical protein
MNVIVKFRRLRFKFSAATLVLLCNSCAGPRYDGLQNNSRFEARNVAFQYQHEQAPWLTGLHPAERTEEHPGFWLITLSPNLPGSSDLILKVSKSPLKVSEAYVKFDLDRTENIDLLKALSNAHMRDIAPRGVVPIKPNIGQN